MQVALENVPGVSPVHLVQVKEGGATDNELVDAVANANGMMSYSATLVSGQSLVESTKLIRIGI